MHSRLKVLRRGEEITLISRNDGTALAWVLIFEVAILPVLNAQLAGVLPDSGMLWLPALASLALVVWTARQIRPDIVVTVSRVTGNGRLVRIAPLTGSRTTAKLDLDAIECLSLQQRMALPFGWTSAHDYVVNIELRDGGRHQLSTGGHLLACHDILARFAAAAGLDARLRQKSAG